MSLETEAGGQHLAGLRRAEERHVHRAALAELRAGPAGDRTVAEGTTHANENAGPDNLIYVEVNITGTVPGPAATPARGK